MSTQSKQRNTSRIDKTKAYDGADGPKVTKPAENVMTKETEPSWAFGLALGTVFLAINFFVAAIYFGIINP
ncbi:MAG: photosystem I protein PsaX [Trichocoleus desertorum ATA4-8-CV12]|jgi:hypothetical protein|nr:photosystem I protein PsaX [Trichocoleus desertorum ATA4-8-CV12]